MNKIKGLLNACVTPFKNLGIYFRHGDIKTRLSAIIMGFGCIARGQIIR